MEIRLLSFQTSGILNCFGDCLVQTVSLKLFHTCVCYFNTITISIIFSVCDSLIIYTLTRASDCLLTEFWRLVGRGHDLLSHFLMILMIISYSLTQILPCYCPFSYSCFFCHLVAITFFDVVFLFEVGILSFGKGFFFQDHKKKTQRILEDVQSSSAISSMRKWGRHLFFHITHTDVRICLPLPHLFHEGTTCPLYTKLAVSK